MLATAKTVALALFASIAVTAAAGAQQKAKECEIDEGKPGEVTRAVFSLQVAQNAKPEDAAKQLKSAIASLEKADKSKNPVGQEFELGKALVMWMGQPNMPSVTTRGAVGFTQNPQQPLDLVVAIDSAFSVVEKAMPECTSQTSAWRAQKGWVTLINSALNALNAGQSDSAEVLAKRSLILNPNAPYGYMVLGNLAQSRNQTRQAIDNFKKTVEKAGTDTTYADLRRQTLLTAAKLAAEAYDTASAATKADYAKDAKSLFQGLLDDPKAANYADQARCGMAKLSAATGDSAAVRTAFAEQLRNPATSSFTQLLNAAVCLAQTNQVADATTLFQAAYKKNPYHRDVLYNLAIMYLNGDKYDKAIPTARELVAVDPSNGDNYRLFTIAYASEAKRYNEKIKNYNALAKKAKLPKAVKAYEDTARIYFDSAKAVNDSALKYNTINQGFPMKLSFNQFANEEGKSTLGGTIVNNTDQPQTYTVKFDFVDAAGKVVSSQTATVGPVSPGQSGKFSVTGTGAGIAAFRYAPLVDPSTIKPKA